MIKIADKQYKSRELKFFDGLEDSLIVMMFEGHKRQAIRHIIKKAYDRGLRRDLF